MNSAVLELAGLLQAGIPARAARDSIEHRLAQLEEIQRAEFDAIWKLAQDAGGSISAVMQSLSAVFGESERHRREIALAFAGPKATARLVNLLPIISIGLAQLLGLNPVGAVFSKPIALISVLSGLALLLFGRSWSRSLLAKAQSQPSDPGLFLDGVRFCLQSGLPLSEALAKTTRVFEAIPGVSSSSIDVDAVLGLADMNRERGASLVALLESAARIKREQKRYEESAVVAKLSVRLMLPLGLLTLPAFILIAIAPIAIGLLSAG